MSAPDKERRDARAFLAYDATLKRPGCVLLQAALRGDVGLARRFPVESWLDHPTPDMRVYPVTPEQADLLVEMAEADLRVDRSVVDAPASEESRGGGAG